MGERVLTPAQSGTTRPERPSRRSFGHDLRRAFAEGERGTAVVEFAIIAPLLFLLVFGLIDFARALNYYNDLTQLAGQGARAAAVSRNPDGTDVGASITNDSQCTSITWSIQCQLVRTYTTTAELQNGIDVCMGVMNGSGALTNALPSPGSPITVRATYRFTFLPLVKLGSIRLKATQSERSEVLTPTYKAGVDQANSAGGDACQP